MGNKKNINSQNVKTKKKAKVPFVTIFKSLYSNQAAIESRKRPWYWFLVITVLSVFLVWIPRLTSGYKSNAAGALAATSNYEVTKALKHVINEEDYFKSIKVAESSDGKLVLDRDSLSGYGASSPEATWNTEYCLQNNIKPLFRGNYNDSSAQDASAYIKNFTNKSYEYYFDCIGVKNTGNRNKPSVSQSSASTTVEYETEQTTFLEAYYFPKLSSSEENYSVYLNNFISSVILDRDKDGKLGRYPHSFLLLGQDFRNVGFFALQTTKSVTQRSATYQGNVSEGLEGIGAKKGDTFYAAIRKDYSNINDIYDKGFVSFAHASGRKATIQSTWLNIAMASGIVGGLILLGALILFLRHRRKVSAYRDTNFYHALKESAARTFTPSLIARILGFMSPQYRYRVLIAGVLRRIVFANNKICPPRNTQSDNKPLYQARD